MTTPKPVSAAETLAATPLFSTLPPDDLAAIAALARPRRWPAGAVLFQRGDDGREMIVVADGRVRLSVLSAEGRELSLRHAGPGALLGEMAALDGAPRSADATAVGDVAGLVLARADVDRLIAERPAIARAIIGFLCARLRETTEQMESIALYRLEARLARFLIAMLRAEGADLDGGKSLRLDLALNQSEIADMLGASRPKVNGALTALEAAGAVRRDGKALVCRLDPLRAIAEGEV